ncbi:helix-turn-helix domain-containing protein [Streptacidiphilus sp. 4-A2]|nr:helix-turn-helix domain-containing protein [Streptacidiphilus sp. 4-A2]
MRFNLLGPVTVDTDQGRVELPAGLPRTLLAVLLLHPNTVVSREQLAEALWGLERPASLAASLRNHVSRLRAQLGPQAAGRIRTVAPGYLVQVHEGELDERLFLEGCRKGRVALRSGTWRPPPTCWPRHCPCGGPIRWRTRCTGWPSAAGCTVSRRPGSRPWRAGSRRNCGWGGTGNWWWSSGPWRTRIRCARPCTGS